VLHCHYWHVGGHLRGPRQWILPRGYRSADCNSSVPTTLQCRREICGYRSTASPCAISSRTVRKARDADCRFSGCLTSTFRMRRTSRFPPDPIGHFVDFETKMTAFPRSSRSTSAQWLATRMLPPSSINLSAASVPIGAGEIRIADLPKPTRTKLADQGLLMPVRTDGKNTSNMPWPGSRKHPRFASRRSPERGVIVAAPVQAERLGTSSDTILRRILRSTNRSPLK